MTSSNKVMSADGPIVNALLTVTTNDAERERPWGGLRSSEIRYRRLFEAARDGILILNATTLEITDANPFMEELLGYSHAEFLGKELWQIGLFADKEASKEVFRELQQTGYTRYEDLPLQTRHGERREVEFVSNVYDEDRQQVIQCNIRDITERKRVENERRMLLETVQLAHAQAEMANNIKDEFLATLSHELRTPLTSILGWSTMLNDGNLDEQTSKRAVDIIIRNARAQRELIDDLLDTSRIITGKLRLDVRPVDLAPVIETIVDGVRPAVEAKGIHLELSIDPLTGPVSGDPVRLQQILWNLLNNAIKFTTEGGGVRLWLKRIESQVEIGISDTGEGISAELLPHIFDRFRQSDSSSTRRHGGLGLGLSIVRQLVSLHGGTVTVESPGMGAGTTFKVLFPLAGVHQEVPDEEIARSPIQRQVPDDPQMSLANLRVLVVDNESDTRDLITTVLLSRGANVVPVRSAIEALKAMERELFDVLVSDIGMPVMDGYALIRKVRELPSDRGGKIPAAALTAYAGVEANMDALAAGYDMHIPKPVEPNELATVVGTLGRRSVPPPAKDAASS